MIRCVARLALALLTVGCALFGQVVDAHEYKLDALINAFVTIEPGTAHLVVRAPLYLFKSAKFALKDVEIDVPGSTPGIERALTALQKDVVLFEDGQALTASSAKGRLSLPSDKSFGNYADALRHVAEPVAEDTHIIIDQGYVDAHFTYALRSQNSELTIRTTAAPELGDYLKVVVRYTPLEGDSRTLMITSQSGTVALNPTWFRAALGFIGMGLAHIVSGTDHLLFLLCLIIPLRGWRQILAVVTTFTIAHSITLIGSAFQLAPSGAWFPPFVETAIAASIVYMALENIMGVELRRRLIITGTFGLIHGFGFSYGLQENLQFAGTHLLTSLFAFNIGVELGQLLVLAVMLPALLIVRRYVLTGRTGMIILSAIVAQIGWQWMVNRGDALMKVRWPQPTLAGLAVLAVWIAGVLIGAGVITSIVRRMQPLADTAIQSTHGAAAD
jgi:hypothetical protein